MNATRVLVVEDDPNIVDLVRSNLLVRGFEVEVATTGAVVLDLVASYDPEIVLLDLMLPDADGFDICRDLRQRYDVGLIVVSARTAEQDKVRALNLGADDYLTKPFGIEELMARMTATLRRSRIAGSPEPVGDILLGDIRVGLEAKAVFKGGERVQLTPTEFSLLRYLALNAGSLLSYEQLLREVWGRGYENSREYVRVYVGRLRSKLEDENGPALIVTEPRAGYRLVIPD
jgi:two-component system, OmpR family, KDP operon response regulator KdpE